VKLTRKALEVLRDCDMNKLPCSECLPHKPPEQACYQFQVERGEIAALALRLAEVVKAFVPICDGLEDAGPDGEGWQSDELVDALAAARSLLAELEG
jgi:hypothetical protein